MPPRQVQQPVRLGRSAVGSSRQSLVDTMPLDAMIGHFESLGDNCEFGIVQRQCGLTRPGLLQFARTPPDALLAALRANFDGVDDISSVRLLERGEGVSHEFVLVHERLGIVCHIATNDLSVPRETVLATEIARLVGLAGTLIDDLKAGERIFVTKCNQDLTSREARSTLEALSAYGPNTLLYVVRADARHAAGDVRWVEPNLMVGYIDRFAPYNDAYDTSFDVWTELCRNALRLHWSASRAPRNAMAG